ncbi:MAG TPA: hypothetical protein VN931_06175 [Fibrobacteria bacterium]|nr:hypothetical protein [Fibrobacteria bacterium]
MKHMFFLVALVATSSFAYQTPYEQKLQEANSPVRFGLDVGGIFTVPSVWPSDGTDTKLGLGLRVVPAIEYSVGDHFDLRGFAGYEFTTWGYRFLNSDGSLDDYSVNTQFLTFGIAGQYNFTRRGSFASLGFSTDLPLRSEATDNYVDNNGPGTISGPFHGDQSPVYLDFGLGRQLTESVGLVLGYRLPLVPYYDQGGFTIDLDQFNIGLRFTLP